MKSYKEFIINEGLNSERIISGMVDIILNQVSDKIEETKNKYRNYQYGVPDITYKFKTIFSGYKGDSLIGDFISKCLDFMKVENFNPVIKFSFNIHFNIMNHQEIVGDTNGHFNTMNMDLTINMYLPINIKKTLSHELRHLYDFVLQKGQKYDDDVNDYKNNPIELRARFTGFVNSYTNWNNKFEDVLTDLKKVMKTDFDKRFIKLLYQVYSVVKDGKLHNIEIKPKKEFEGKKSVLDKVIKEFEKNGISYRWNLDRKTLFITTDILSIINIDNDIITYPLLEMVLKTYDSGNFSIAVESVHEDRSSVEGKKRYRTYGEGVPVRIDVLRLIFVLDDLYQRKLSIGSSRRGVSRCYFLSKDKKIVGYETGNEFDKNIIYDNIINKMKSNTLISNQIEKLMGEVGLTSELNYKTLFSKIKSTGTIFPMAPEFYNKWKENFGDVKVYNYKWKDQEFYIINITDWLLNKNDAQITEIK